MQCQPRPGMGITYPGTELQMVVSSYMGVETQIWSVFLIQEPSLPHPQIILMDRRVGVLCSYPFLNHYAWKEEYTNLHLNDNFPIASASQTECTT